MIKYRFLYMALQTYVQRKNRYACCHIWPCCAIFFNEMANGFHKVAKLSLKSVTLSTAVVRSSNHFWLGTRGCWAIKPQNMYRPICMTSSKVGISQSSFILEIRLAEEPCKKVGRYPFRMSAIMPSFLLPVFWLTLHLHTCKLALLQNLFVHLQAFLNVQLT